MVERKQKKVVEITGLETLYQEEKLPRGRNRRKDKYFSRKKQHGPGDDDDDEQKASNPSTLPVVDEAMTDDELRRELVLRNPTAELSGSRQRLLGQLKPGTISILKARESATRVEIDKLDRVSSSMTVEHLRREFLHRHPDKKKIARGKWSSWLLLQLGEGSICVAPEEIKLLRDSRPESPQSVSHTVSTAPTVFSSSAMSSLTESSSIYASSYHKTGKASIVRKEAKAEQQSNEKKDRVKPSLSSEEKCVSAQESSAPITVIDTGSSSDNKTKQSRHSMGSKQKYFDASKAARRNAKCDGSEKPSALNSNAKCDGSKNQSALSSNAKCDGSEKQSALSSNVKCDDSEKQSTLSLNAKCDGSEKQSALSLNAKCDGIKKQSALSSNVKCGGSEKKSALNRSRVRVRERASGKKGVATAGSNLSPVDQRTSEQSTVPPADSKPSKFASTKWLNSVKEARKQSRRSLCQRDR